MIAGIEHVAALIQRESGIALGPTRMPSLAAAVERVAPGLDGATVARAAAAERGASGLLARLIEEVAVNETFFFRHRRELDAIDWSELARTARAGGRDGIRVWSAACASGEEPYTLAMMACEAFGSAMPPVSILASDISGRALHRARAGIYRDRSVRLVPGDVRARYLVVLGDGYGIRPQLRLLVRFEQHNLVSDPFQPPDAGRFDLIVCRNVLIYFEPDVVTRVLASLERVLAPGGTLLLGTADRLCGSAFQRNAAHPQSPRRPVRRPPPHSSRRRQRPAGARPAPSLASALKAADAGRLDDAIAITDTLLARDRLNCDAHYLRGVVELARGDGGAAVTALRRALYLEPQFLAAAFQLGRAHESLSQDRAARRSYTQALRILDQGHADRPGLIEGLDAADVEAACRARLRALAPGRAAGGERAS